MPDKGELRWLPTGAHRFPESHYLATGHDKKWASIMHGSVLDEPGLLRPAPRGDRFCIEGGRIVIHASILLLCQIRRFQLPMLRLTDPILLTKPVRFKSADPQLRVLC